jgi:hypothetical protein
MYGVIRLVGLLSAVVLCSFNLAPLQSADPKKELTEDEMREKLLAKPFLEGKLVDVETKADDKTFTLKVVWQVKTPNVEGAKKFRQVARGLQQRGANARKSGNKAEFDKARDEYLAAEAACYDVVETPLDFHLLATADFKVRRLELPEKDPGADGKPGRYTEKEKNELKGNDPKLPGYKADLKDLDEGSIVRVYLDKPKKPTGAAPGKDKPADKEKTADKEKPKEKEGDAAETVYPVSVIVLLPEPKGDASNPFGK